MFSDVMSWMMKTILGIQPTNPGCSHVKIAPHFFDGLSFAKGHIDCPQGKVSVEWQKFNEVVKMTVTVTGSLTVECSGKILKAGTNTLEMILLLKTSDYEKKGRSIL